MAEEVERMKNNPGKAGNGMMPRILRDEVFNGAREADRG